MGERKRESERKREKDVNIQREKMTSSIKQELLEKSKRKKRFTFDKGSLKMMKALTHGALLFPVCTIRSPFNQKLGHLKSKIFLVGLTNSA